MHGSTPPARRWPQCGPGTEVAVPPRTARCRSPRRGRAHGGAHSAVWLCREAACQTTLNGTCASRGRQSGLTRAMARGSACKTGFSVSCGCQVCSPDPSRLLDAGGGYLAGPGFFTPGERPVARLSWVGSLQRDWCTPGVRAGQSLGWEAVALPLPRTQGAVGASFPYTCCRHQTPRQGAAEQSAGRPQG